MEGDRTVKGHRSRRRLGVAIAPLVLAFVSLTGLHAAAGAGPAIEVLSTRADLVSGGVALVAVTLPAGVTPASAHVTVNGSDATSAFALRSNGRFEGLLSGLAL